MATFQGKRVSRQWKRVLDEAAKHVKFTLDSGRRTMLEQTALWRAFLKRGKRPPLVAFPNPNAPHIRVGRQNHCLDVNQLDGGAQRLAAYLSKHGVHVVFNVRGEPWHMDPVNARELRSFYIRLRKQDKRRGHR